MTLELYLDPAGAAPLAPAAREAVVAALDTYGDPLMISRPRPRGASAPRGCTRRRGTRDRRASRRDRVHIRRHRVGGARDLGRRARPARLGTSHRDERDRAPGGPRHLRTAGCGRLRDRDRAVRWTGSRRPRPLRRRGPRAGYDDREPAAREPRDRHDAADRGGRAARSRRRRAVPLRRRADGRPAPDRRGRPRRRSPQHVGAQVRRATRRRYAVHPSRRGAHPVSERRRPRAKTACRHGEHTGHRGHGRRARGLAREPGGRGGASMGAHGDRARTDRDDGPGSAGARTSNAPDAPPRLLLGPGARSRNAGDGARRPRHPRRRRVARDRTAGGPLTGPRGDGGRRRARVPRERRTHQHRSQTSIGSSQCCRGSSRNSSMSNRSRLPPWLDSSRPGRRSRDERTQGDPADARVGRDRRGDRRRDRLRRWR